MTDVARVDPAAIDAVARALVRYGTAEERVMAQVDSAIQQAAAQAQSEQRRWRGELEAAEAVLRACQSKKRADCSKPAEAVRKVRGRLDRADQAARAISAAVSQYQEVKSRHKTTVQVLVQNGRAHLNRKSRQLNTYLAAGGTGSATGGVGGESRGGSDARMATLGMIGKAVVTQGAKVAAIPLALGGIENLAHTEGALNGVDSLVDDAISSVRDSALGVRFEQIGDAMSHLRSRLDG